MTFPMTDLPALLHAIRDHYGCTWVELARRMGMNSAQLKQWASGVKSPGWNTVMPRLAALGVAAITVPDTLPDTHQPSG